MKEPSEILQEIAEENSYEGWYSFVYDSHGHTVHEFTELAMTRYAEQATKWIDVNDRLPKQATFVNAYKKNGLVLGLYFNSDKEFKYGKDDQSNQVTHWMPLPSPPLINKKD